MSTRKTQRRKYRNKPRGKSRSKLRRKYRNKSRRKKIHKKNIAGSSNSPLSKDSLQILIKLRNASSNDQSAFFERLLDLYKNKDNKSRFETLANSLRKNISPDKSKRTRILNNIKDGEIRKLVAEISAIVDQKMEFNKKGGARQGYYRDATICEMAIGLIMLVGKCILGLTLMYYSVLAVCLGDHECAERTMNTIFGILNFLTDLIRIMEATAN